MGPKQHFFLPQISEKESFSGLHLSTVEKKIYEVSPVYLQMQSPYMHMIKNIKLSSNDSRNYLRVVIISECWTYWRVNSSKNETSLMNY